MQAGDLVAERFELIERIGSGGMGRVFRASDRETGETVALKLVAPSDDMTEVRFAREANLLASLDHPRFARYIAHGYTHGQRYLAMEWLDGESLAQRLARGPLSVKESLGVVLGAADALAVAHGSGVIHRDVKPSNLFLVNGDPLDLRVLDLGIARLVQGGRRVTRTGALLGTPAYMAPEQVRGGVDLDARVDVYGLGCVLFECLSGRPAFRGEDIMAVFCRILLEDPPSLADEGARVPTAVEDLVYHMLERDRDQRPKDGAAVAQAIRSLRETAGRDRGPRSTGAGITAGEREIRSVVLVAAVLDDTVDVAATTLAGDPDTGFAERIAKAAAEFDGKMDWLANGSLVVTLAAAGAATDLAQRAARCALALHTAAPRNPIAMATGRADVSGQQRSGEVFDRAARLLRSAIERGREPRVHADDVTVGLVGRQFEVGGDEHGLVLLSEREVYEPVRTLLGRPTTFVGRDRELLTLEAVYAECQNELVAQAVLVTGDAGSGKSRLRYELQRRLAGRGDPVEVWIGRAEPHTVGSALGMLGGAIRRAAGVRDGEPLALQQGRLRARVSRHLADDAARRVVPFIAELAGVAFSDDELPELRAARDEPRLMAEQLWRAWQEWLTVECVAQPLVILLEDFHWGDPATAQYVDRTLGELSELPLMVLALARPELEVSFPRLWAGRRVTSIRLGELPRRAAERLAHEVLGKDADPDLVARIVEHAGGNAFYLEELIRAVADGRSELPPTVLAMVQSRLAELPAETRRVLRAGSVFGTSFWRGGVSAVTGGDARSAGLDETLALLVADEIISRRVESKFPGEDEYVFRHGLVREASYESLTADDRRVAHKLAAAWLERTGESDLRALAAHFELSEQPARAAEMHLLAGWRLLSEGFPDAAIDSFRRADELGVASADVPKLARGMLQSHRFTDRYPELIAWVNAKLEGELSPRGQAAVLEVRIRALRQLDAAAAIEGADEALRACAAVGDLERYAAVLADASFAAYRRSDVDAASRFAGLARERSFGSAKAEFYALRAQMFAATAAGLVEESLALSTEIRRRALEAGDLAAAANESNNMAESLLELGFSERAANAADDAAVYAEQSGHRTVGQYSRVLRMCCDAEGGDVDRAIERGVHLMPRLNRMFLIDTSRFVGHYLLARGKRGDAEQALRIATLALDTAQSAGVYLHAVALIALQARAHVASGNREAALERLAAARHAADADLDNFSAFQLAVAEAEVAAPGWQDAIAAARGQLLREAARRADRKAYLTGNSLHVRVLMASGGMPDESEA